MRLTSRPPPRPSTTTSAWRPTGPGSGGPDRLRCRRCRRRRTASRRPAAAPDAQGLPPDDAARLVGVGEAERLPPLGRVVRARLHRGDVQAAGDRLALGVQQDVEIGAAAQDALDQRLVQRRSAPVPIDGGQHPHLAPHVGLGPRPRLGGRGDIDVGQEAPTPPRRTGPGTAASAGTACAGRARAVSCRRRRLANLGVQPVARAAHGLQHRPGRSPCRSWRAGGEMWTSMTLVWGSKWYSQTFSSSMVRVTDWPAWRIRNSSSWNSRGCRSISLPAPVHGAGDQVHLQIADLQQGLRPSRSRGGATGPRPGRSARRRRRA